MARIIADRVNEVTTTTGTGNIALGGAVVGYQSFSDKMSDGDTTFYTIENGVHWEVGIGTYISGSNSISRDTILDSSNSGNAVSWGAGSKNIFMTLPGQQGKKLNDLNTPLQAVYGADITAGTPVRIANDGGTPKAYPLTPQLSIGSLTALTEPNVATNHHMCQVNEKIFVSVYNDGSGNKARLVDFTDGTPVYGTPIAIHASLNTIVGVGITFNKEKVLVFADNNEFQLFFINYPLKHPLGAGTVTLSTDAQHYTLPDRQSGSGMLFVHDMPPERIFPIEHVRNQMIVYYKNTSGQLAHQGIDMEVNATPAFSSISVGGGGVNSNVIAVNTPNYINVVRIAEGRVVIMYGDTVDSKTKAYFGEINAIGNNLRLQKTTEHPYIINAGAAGPITLLPITENGRNDNSGVFVYVKSGGGIEARHAFLKNNYNIDLEGSPVTIESDTSFDRALDSIRGVAQTGWRSDFGYVLAGNSSSIKLYQISVSDKIVRVENSLTHVQAPSPQASQSYIFKAGVEDFTLSPADSKWLHWNPRVVVASKDDYAGIAQETKTSGQQGIISTAGMTSTAHSGLTTGSPVFVDVLGRLTHTVTPVKVGRALSATSMLVDYADGRTPQNIITVGYGDRFDYKLDPGSRNCQVKINEALYDLALRGGGEVRLGPGRMIISHPIFVLGSNVRLRGAGMDVTEIFLNDYMDEDGICGGDGFGNFHYVPDESGVFSLTDNQSFSDFTIEGNMYRQSSTASHSQKQADGLLDPAHTRNLLRLRMDSQNAYGGVTERVKFKNGIQNGLSVESVLHYNVRDCQAYNCFFNYYNEFTSQINYDNCHSQHARFSGFRSFSCGEIIYTNCISRSDDGSAFSHQVGRANSFIGCSAHRPGWHADMKNKSAHGFELSSVTEDKIIGCNIFAAQGSGIVMHSTTNTEIAYNSFQRNGQLVDLTNNDIAIFTSNCNGNTFSGNTFENTPVAFYSNRARYNFVSTVVNGSSNNTFIGNKPGPAALGYSINFPGNDADDNTRQIFNGDSYFAGKIRQESTAVVKHHLKTSNDGSEATIQRSEASAEFKITNKVAGPPATPYSIVFDDTNKSVVVTSHANFDLRATDFTISTWVKLDNNTNVNRVCGRGGSYRLDIYSSNRMSWSIDEVGQSSINTIDPSNYNIPTGQWVHIAIKRNNSTGQYTFYANGVTRGSFTPAGNKDVGAPSGPLIITAADNCMAGKMDDFRIYRRLLTDSEINTTLATGGDPDSTGLVLQLPFNEGTGTIARDLTGNGQHGTLTNGPTWSTDVPAALPGQTQDDADVTILRSVDGPAPGVYGRQTFGDPLGETIVDGLRTIIRKGMFEEGAAPSTPPTGKVAIYAKTDGKLYAKDDAGTEYDLTASGSATVADGDMGDVTVSSSGTVWTIDAGTITLAKMANLAANSIIGNNTGSSATPIALTASQVRTLIDALAAANNLSDVASAATAFSNIKQAATTSATGVAELATTAETSTGTDTARVVTPDGLSGSVYGEKSYSIAVFQSDIDTAVGDGKVGFCVPASMNGMDIVTAVATVHTAGTTGTTDVQIRRRRATTDVDVLSTKLTIDSAETSSTTAAAALVVNTSNDDLQTGDLLFIDVDAVSTTKAKGLFVTVTARMP